MQSACEYVNACKFVQKFKDHAKTIENRYLDKFCLNWFNSEDCQRKQQILTGECRCQPPATLSPDGSYIL